MDQKVICSAINRKNDTPFWRLVENVLLTSRTKWIIPERMKFHCCSSM